jgi:hypothetical protein
MEGMQIQGKHIKVAALLSIVLFLTGVYLYRSNYQELYRALRAVIPLSFLLVLFMYKGRNVNWLSVTFLLLFGTANVVGIWYETNIYGHLYMILNTCAFLFLIGALSPKISFKKLSLYIAGFSIVLVLVNAYLLFVFIELIRDYALGELHYFLVMMSSMSLVITGILSLLYNHRFSSKVSLLFTFFVFVLIFAEVFRVISFYDLAYENFSEHLSRALLLLGCSLLVHYELVDKKEQEALGNAA